MSPSDQIKLLISLAQIDGSVSSDEEVFIKRIAKEKGVELSLIDAMLATRHELHIPENLTPEDRFDYLYSLIQLMKIDDRMMREELLFCSTIASNLGFKRSLVLDLILHADDKRPVSEQRKTLLEIAARHYESGNSD